MKFFKIVLSILILQISLIGAEKKYDKVVTFKTLEFQFDKISQKSKDELSYIISEMKKYKPRSKKMLVKLTVYSTEIAEENGEYIEKMLKESGTIKKSRIHTKYLIAKDEDDSTNNINLVLYMNLDFDKDNDGVHMDDDKCLDTIKGAEVGQDGCRITDKDNDGVHIDNDECPDTLSGVEVGLDGCRITDKDQDGVHVDYDKCPQTIKGAEVDSDGCRITDKDNDGVHIDDDLCPNTLVDIKVGVDGCKLDSVVFIVNKKRKSIQLVSNITKLKSSQKDRTHTLYYNKSGLSLESKQELERLILNIAR